MLKPSLFGSMVLLIFDQSSNVTLVGDDRMTADAHDAGDTCHCLPVYNQSVSLSISPSIVPVVVSRQPQTPSSSSFDGDIHLV